MAVTSPVRRETARSGAGAAPARVFLCEGEGIGWAVDEDRRLALEMLRRLATGDGARVRLVDDLADADAVHCVWWEVLARIPEAKTAGRRVICHLCGDVSRCVADPRFALTAERVTDWIAPSRKALDELRLFADRVHFVPYAVDWDTFAGGALDEGELHPGVRRAAAEVARLRARGAYIVGSIARDTEGWSLAGGHAPAPKLVKGPDVLVESVGVAREMGLDVAVLLAGPRRHWVRAALRERGIPVVFAGEEIGGDHDDFGRPGVMLGAPDVAALYRLMDVHVCASRSEGGPRPVLEAAAAGCAQLSTRVGHAPDVLRPECLFHEPAEAGEALVADARQGTLRRFVGVHREVVRAGHTPEALEAAWRGVYEASAEGAFVRERAPMVRVARGAARRLAVWFRYQDGAWGGGNQFHKALRTELERRGVEVVVAGDEPERAAACTVHFAESLQFDDALFRKVVDRKRHRLVHRFDGPVSMIRRTAESWELDRKILALNEAYASWSVMQSIFSVRRWTALGLPRRRMVVVPNAPDPSLFFAMGERSAPGPGGRVRVMASSWAPNPGKGAPVYAWMGRHLDPSRYELTFVGRVENELPGWTIKDAVGSRELGAELRTHDVYVTASREDPCSNAVCEALATGLPTLYLREGGHPELVGAAGVGFELPGEIPAALDRIASHWAAYRRLIAPWSIGRVADVYEGVMWGGDR